jgi:hypothetical protein
MPGRTNPHAHAQGYNPVTLEGIRGILIRLLLQSIKGISAPQKDSRFHMANKPAFKQADQVEHPKFGLGSVLSCSDEYIVIKFDDHGEKKFVLTIVLPNLKKSDRTPPVEKRRTTKKKIAAPVAAG